MHEYRNVLIRLRAGDGDREIARLGLMGRVKVPSFREQARSLGWLQAEMALPDAQAIAQSLGAVTKRPSSTVSKGPPLARTGGALDGRQGRGCCHSCRTGTRTPVSRQLPADEDLHELIAERYERTATIVTSNLDFTEWDQAFPANPVLASATLDRLRHNAYCLVLDGQSYRTPRQMPTTMPTKTKNSTQQINGQNPHPSDVRLAPSCWLLYAEN